MSLTDTSPAVAPPDPTRWHLSARCLWLALVLGWVAMVVVVLTVGARPASFHDLERAVAAGEVHEVWVEGGLGPGGRGYATVRVTWRDGPIEATVEIAEYHGRDYYALARSVSGTELYFRSPMRVNPGEPVRLAAPRERVLVYAK